MKGIATSGVSRLSSTNNGEGANSMMFKDLNSMMFKDLNSMMFKDLNSIMFKDLSSIMFKNRSSIMFKDHSSNKGRKNTRRIDEAPGAIGDSL